MWGPLRSNNGNYLQMQKLYTYTLKDTSGRRAEVVGNIYFAWELANWPHIAPHWRLVGVRDAIHEEIQSANLYDTEIFGKLCTQGTHWNYIA